MNGNKVKYIHGVWVYEDNIPVKDNPIPPCPRCGKVPSLEGHDACIANLPGVKNACCGHGVHRGYIQFIDGRIIRGDFLPIENPKKIEDEK